MNIRKRADVVNRYLSAAAAPFRAPSAVPARPASAPHARGCCRTYPRMAANRRKTRDVPAGRRSCSDCRQPAVRSARPRVFHPACQESGW